MVINLMKEDDRCFKCRKVFSTGHEPVIVYTAKELYQRSGYKLGCINCIIFRYPRELPS